MGHLALEIENWEIVALDGDFKFSYNNRVGYIGLNIDANKFYFFLKNKFGPPNIDFSSVANFFPIRDISIGKVWSYLFRSEYNYILINGDDRINITVLSINEPPDEFDFNLFCSSITGLLKMVSLESYEDLTYNIYINYTYYLDNLILELKNLMKIKIPKIPDPFYLDTNKINSDDPYVDYEKFQYKKDYNQWLEAILKRASLTLEIQILLPIYLESLIDLAFRLKLNKNDCNYLALYGKGKKKLNIFEYFERSPLFSKSEQDGTISKIELIRTKCSQVNENKLIKFSYQLIVLADRELRNKIIHGNSLFFKNLNLKYYYDDGYLIGFPDRHNGIRIFAESIQSCMIRNDIFKEIKKYKILCDLFIDIFEDGGHFSSLANGIAFGYNSIAGGSISVGINKFEDLFFPDEN